MESWDVVIIGAGAAGLTAGIYAVRNGLKALILEEKMAGGTMIDAPLIENYPGFERLAGMDLAQRLVAHSRKAGAAIHEFESVTALDLAREKKTVHTGTAAYEAKALIIASGSHYREVGVPGEKEFRGRGVSYCGLCDGPLFKGKRVLVVGGGNSALITALYLSENASEVKIAHRRDAFRAEEALVKALRDRKNVEVLWNNELKEIKGDKTVSGAVLFNNGTGETWELPVNGVFVQVGEDPNSQIAGQAGVETDAEGYVKVDILQHTNIDGVFAAGDVTNQPVKQVGTAVGQAITAAVEAYNFIRRPYYKQ